MKHEGLLRLRIFGELLQLHLILCRTLMGLNGITSPVDGEYFQIKHTFIFRRSTLRMLNQLKAAHPNENTYLSPEAHAAIQHYYYYIFNEGGPLGTPCYLFPIIKQPPMIFKFYHRKLLLQTSFHKLIDNILYIG